MSEYAFVIVNPVSAGGNTGRRWPLLRAALDKVLGRWDHAFTLKPGDGTRLARQAVEEGYELIVSVGGDGTAREVVSGMFEHDTEGARPRKEGVIFSPVRHGTGGDFARLFELPSQLPAAVEHLKSGRVRALDVGWSCYRKEGGALESSMFLNIASAGMSGMIDEKVNASKKRLGGKLSFMGALGRALVEYRSRRMQVWVDGVAFYEGPVVLAAAANGQYFGGGMRVARQATPDDGWLDLLVVTKAGPLQLARAYELYNGKLKDWSSVRVARGKQIELKPVDEGDRMLLDIDGEQAGVAPMQVSLLPGALPVKLP